jgi:PIN domain nuclease of toxin-antitoxin system
LLDTHVIIWLIENSSKIPLKIKEIVELSQNNIYISSISLWEIAIKMNSGKLDLKFTFDELTASIKNSEFEILQIEDEYLSRLALLPLIHKDPFDRLLISSALAEELTIITIDDNIQKYDVSWIW